MPTKKKLLKRLEKQVVNQERGKIELENLEKATGKDIDITKAPAIEVEEELQRKWKEEETEREITEPKEFTSEGLYIEKDEEKGESPYPEIEKSIKMDADEEDEVEQEEEEEAKEKEKEEGTEEE